MYLIDEETGDMTIRQGDSYSFTVEGVDSSYTMYHSVYNSQREIIFEVSAIPNENDETTFEITPAETNLLTVPVNRKKENYYYGIKRCKNGYEDTLIVGNKEVGELNKMTVYPLITEGDENGAS